jgi:hypothetical protein
LFVANRFDSNPTGEATNFQIAVHNFEVTGKTTEVLIKLDRRTGKTWKFDGANQPTWRPIGEPKTGEKPPPYDVPRYELVCHNFEKGGREHELVGRGDRR